VKFPKKMKIQQKIIKFTQILGILNNTFKNEISSRDFKNKRK